MNESDAFVLAEYAHSDGKRFLMAKRGELSENEPQHLIWVQNWLDEVKRKVPTD